MQEQPFGMQVEWKTIEFAAGNPKGATTAVKIARDILRK
jgi:hypothetical protein